MYSKIFLRLEPLGLELVAQAVCQAGYEVRLIDLQVETHKDYFKLIDRWEPDVVAFSCNYLANVPEIVDLAKLTQERLPMCREMVDSKTLYVHAEHGRQGRAFDDSTEHFVNETRMGTRA
jgi:hypothetical protein